MKPLNELPAWVQWAALIVLAELVLCAVTFSIVWSQS